MSQPWIIPPRRHDVACHGQHILAGLLTTGKRTDLTRYFEITLALRFRPELNFADLNGALLKTIVQNPELANVYRFDAAGELIVSRLQIDAFGLKVHDLRSASEAEVQSAILAAADREMKIDEGPLLTLEAFRHNGGGCTLLLRVSHMNVDGWATELLVARLLQNYLGLAPAPALISATFEDFVDWEAAQVDGAAGEQEWSYWREVFKRIGDKIPLPTGTQMPIGDTRRFFAISGDQVERLRGIARRMNLSMFVTLLCAFGKAIANLTGCGHIPLRSNVANRLQPGFADIIGCMANSNALILHYREGEEFLTAARRCDQAVNEAFAHQSSFWWSLRKMASEPEAVARPALDQFHFQKWSAQPRGANPVAALLYDPNLPPQNTGAFELCAVRLPRERAYRDITTGYYEGEREIIVETYFRPANVSVEFIDHLLAEMKRLLESLS